MSSCYHAVDAEKGYNFLPYNGGPFLNLTQCGFPFGHSSTINGRTHLNRLSVHASFF